MKRSYLTGRRVKLGPTKVGLVIMRFQLGGCMLVLGGTRDGGQEGKGGGEDGFTLSLRFSSLFLRL